MTLGAASVWAMMTPSQAPAGSAPSWVSLLPIAAVFVIFYVLLIRPMNKRQKEHAKMVDALKPGDKVVCAGGLHAIVVGVSDSTVQVRIADQVRVDVEKSSVTTVKATE
jgi:preprotein translocase subunit YajC